MIQSLEEIYDVVLLSVTENPLISVPTPDNPDWMENYSVNYNMLAKDVKRRLGRLTKDRLKGLLEVYQDIELGMEIIGKVVAMDLNVSQNNLGGPTVLALT